MYARKSTKSISIVLVLLTASLSILGLYLTGLGGIGPVHATGPVVLGLDCGLGSVEAVPDPVTGIPAADGILDTSCSWAGDADGDTVTDPLVSDDLGNFPGVGGGFTVDIRATGLPLQTNGFDITLSYNTKYLDAILIDQSELVFGDPASQPLILAKTIDRATGTVRMAEVLLNAASTVSGDATFFRVRFDVVGVGMSFLTISDDVMTNPAVVPHKTQQGQFNSVSFFDTSGSLGWDVSWVFSPNPEVPGSPLTFTATASCPGCGTLSYTWDTNGDGVADAGEPAGNPATITAPPPITHRVALTVSDGTNTAFAVRRLPLAVAVQGPSTIAVNTAGTWTGLWLGGIPGATGAYRADWRFCPGVGSTANAVCHKPAPIVVAATGQTSIQTLDQPLPSTFGPGAYHFAGIYTNTLKITDSTGTVAPQLGANVVASATFLVEVTGTPQAYLVTLTSSAPKINTNEQVTFTATVAYAATYPTTTGFRSTLFDYRFDFGDGSSQTVMGGALTATATKTYTTGGTFNVKVITQEASASAVSKIQESSNTLPQLVNAPVVGPTITAVDVSPVSLTAGKPVTFTATIEGGAQPVTVNWDFGDGTTGQGNPVTHSYTVKGPYTVIATAVDANTQSSLPFPIDITVSGQPLSVSITSSSPATAGKPVDFTATVSGGTGPYTVSWSFGDSSTGTGETVSHTYAVKGSYSVTATATDANGGSATASATITVDAQPLIISALCGDGTAGKPISCSASATGGTSPYSFTWDVGADGATDGTGEQFSTTFPVKGTYSIRAIVTDNNGASDQIDLTVSITAQPLVAAASCENGTAGKPVSCTASATGGTGPYTFTWDFGDGTTGSGSDVTHIYNVKGTYTVTVTATDSNSSTDTATNQVTITAQPLVADFTWPTPVTAGTQVTFTATATGGTSPYSFTWDVGKDGTIDGTGPTFTHTFASDGSFSIDMAAIDFNGATALVNKLVTVQPPGLAVDFAFDPASPTAGKPVTFTASATGGTQPYSFSWSFGDQSAGTGSPATHTYSVKGSYVVDLTVTDNVGSTAQAQRTVVVTGQPLVITASCSDGTAGEPITCSASATGGTGPYTFTWDVGKDGSVDGTGDSFATTFPVKGTYSIDAIVTDSNLATARVNLTVNISAQALASDFTFSPASPTAGKPITFTATATGGTLPYSYDWDFGDLTGDTGNPVSHTYAVKGTYTVILIVTDLNGATTQAAHGVTVSPQPLVVNAVVDDTAGNDNGAFEVNEVLTFTATATGGTSAYRFLWAFGDNSTDSANPATHSYPSDGSRSVTVSVTDANNATSSVSFEVNIVGVRTPPVAVMDLYDDAVAADRKISGQTLFITEPVIFDAFASHDTNVPALALSYAWDFDNDGVVDSASPTATFTYTAAGPYTATLTVTNSAGLSDTTSTSGTVYLEAHLTRGKLSWKHHMASGLTQNFIAKARNDASISLNVKLQVNIFNADSGAFVAMVTSPDFPIAPGAIRLDITASWPTPVVLNTTKYAFTGTLLYSVADPVTGNLITGTDDSKSGTFATVP